MTDTPLTGTGCPICGSRDLTIEVLAPARATVTYEGYGEANVIADVLVLHEVHLNRARPGGTALCTECGHEGDLENFLVPESQLNADLRRAALEPEGDTEVEDFKF